MLNKPQYIILHHTGGTDLDPLADTSHHTFEIVDEYHRQKWNFKSSLGYYIGYHYFIDKTGKVTQGRRESDEGAHTKGHNLKSIGICLAGNFDVTMPSEAQKQALETLLKRLMILYSIPKENVVPHRKFANKTCFGKKLPDNWPFNEEYGSVVIKKEELKTPCISDDGVHTDLEKLFILISKIWKKLRMQ